MTGEVRAQLPAFEWVDIGNPGNPTSTSTIGPGYAPGWGASSLLGIGSVDYTFRMSGHETTNLQWEYFRNTVDPNGTNSNGI